MTVCKSMSCEILLLDTGHFITVDKLLSYFISDGSASCIPSPAPFAERRIINMVVLFSIIGAFCGLFVVPILSRLFYSLINHLSENGKVVFVLVVIGICAIIGGKVGNEMFGTYLKLGSYSRNCGWYRCQNTASWKVRAYGRSSYYCDEHKEYAERKYNQARGISESGKKSSSKLSDHYDHDRADAITIAEKTVKSQLKSPSTAKFCSMSSYTVSCSGNTWTVSGYVDAQNSFGASIRNNFTVKFTFSSSSKYTIDSCVIK